jgi:assimilatory nitrate reductase catalytic subunit
MLLLPSARPPGDRALRGRIVCSCFNVSETEIERRRASLVGSNERALETLQAELKCGTNCGSCLPELRRMLIARPDPAEVAVR